MLRKAGVLVLDKRGRFWMYRADPAIVRAAAKELMELLHEPRG